MKFALDPFTIMFVTTLTCVALAGAMASVHLSFRREVEGAGHWALGLVGMAAAGTIFLLRGRLYDEVALPLANLMLTAGVGLSMVGTRRFYGQPPGWRLFHLCWLAELSAVVWWLFVEPNFPRRVAAFSFVVAVFYVDQLRLLWRFRTRHFTSWFFGVLLALQAATVLTRGVAALTLSVDSVNLLRNNPLANFYLAFANFMAILLTVAFLMLATRRLQMILEQRSTQDPLTGVLNRRGFLQQYLQVKARQERSGAALSLMAIDLAHFKAINDRHGHALGDKVLVHVASVVMENARKVDIVARFGGEEFVVLLPETALAPAQQLAQRIQAALRRATPAQLPACTVSIGIASQQQVGESLDSLLSRADAALYRAKDHGRDRIEVAAMGAMP